MIDSSVLKSFKEKDCLVTGGTGLIGRQVVDLLADAGAKVRSVSLDDLELREDVLYAKADLTYRDVCEELTEGMEFVFHLAGVKGSIDVTKSKPASFFVPLLLFNTAMLEACRVHNVRKVIYTSSIGAYASAEVFKEGENEDKPPMDLYAGWAKRVAEMQIQAYRIQYGLKNFCILRPCNVYGPGDNFDPNNAMVIPSLMSKVLQGPFPVSIWGNGSAIRDFLYSKDAAEGIILAAYHMPDVPYINLGSGIGYTIKQLVETFRLVTPFEYAWDLSKSNGFPKRVMDISLAQKRLGFQPSTSLEEGLRKTWDWFKSNQEEYLSRQNYFLEKEEDHETKL